MANQNMNAQQKQDQEKLQNRLSKIKNKILVLSGKGGVGKSTVAANLAMALARAGKHVGLLDIDVHGPSIPKILGLEGEKVHSTEDGIIPIDFSDLLKVISIGFLIPDRDDAVIWRGPLKYNVIMQFLKDVEWGELDYLIVDSPPGTGDEPLSIAQFIGESARAVVVTTPQQLAISDVRKSIRFCSKVGVGVLGVIENMSGFICPHCSQRVDIFKTGGGSRMAEELNVPFLGEIPLDPDVVESGDSGEFYMVAHPDTNTAKAFEKIVTPMLNMTGEAVDVAKSDRPSETMETSDMNSMKIAIPTANGKLCPHFGHCEVFHLTEVDLGSKQILNSEMLKPPAHEPGVLPRWLHEKGADVIIAGGMGQRAQSLFNQNDIEVVVGAPVDTAENIVRAYIDGKLETGGNLCDH